MCEEGKLRVKAKGKIAKGAPVPGGGGLVGILENCQFVNSYITFLKCD